MERNFLNEMLEQKGIPTFLHDVSFSINEKDTNRKIFKKLVSAIKRGVKKHLSNQSLEKQLEICEEYNRICPEFGTVEIIPLQDTEHPDSYKRYLTTLLNRLNKRSDGVFEKIVEELHPIQVELAEPLYGDKNLIGYAYLNEDMPANRHLRSWSLSSYSYSHQYVFDIPTLLAEGLAWKALMLFCKNNIELFQYLSVKTLFKYNSAKDGELIVPSDEGLQRAYIHILLEHGLIDSLEGFKINAKDGYSNLMNRELHTFLSDEVKKKESRLNLENYVLPELVAQLDYVKYRVKQEEENRAGYARSFQTKKHIKKSTTEKMENNAFLEAFGYVEIDNDFSLEAFAECEKEFRKLMEVLPIQYAKDASFRIKKLGKHRAAGLYYSNPINCVIFDVRYTTALIHEYAHYIDYEKDKTSSTLLSERIEFRNVVDLYKSITNKKVRELDDDYLFKIQWLGKTKYNKNYYWQNTEIFARSFELYLYHKGYRSLFLQEEYSGIEYPMDEEYLQAIESYFDKVFSYTPEVEEEQKEKEEMLDCKTEQQEQHVLTLSFSFEKEHFLVGNTEQLSFEF